MSIDDNCISFMCIGLTGPPKYFRPSSDSLSNKAPRLQPYQFRKAISVQSCSFSKRPSKSYLREHSLSQSLRRRSRNRVSILKDHVRREAGMIVVDMDFEAFSGNIDGLSYHSRAMYAGEFTTTSARPDDHFLERQRSQLSATDMAVP